MHDANISPQGYSYGKDPKATNPFWTQDSESVYYKEFDNPKTLERVNSLCYMINFYVNKVSAQVSTTLINALLNVEVTLPFILNGKEALLVCESFENNTLKIVGVLAHEPIDTVEIYLTSGIQVAHDGKDGKDGATGPEGPAGPQGEAGPQGPVGPEGPQGPEGHMGPQGEKGDTGATGPEGPAGKDGSVGPAGPEGPIGPQGPQGESGPAGADGKDGVTPDISVIATVDDTTGTPHVEVTKSGTVDKPIFDFDFTGLKGEKGDGGSGSSYTWKGLASDTSIASNSINDVLSAARAVNATELYIPNLTLTSIDSDGVTTCQYVDTDGSVKNYSTSYTGVSTVGTRVILRTVGVMINLVGGNIVNCSVILDVKSAKIVLRIANNNKIEIEYPTYSFYGYDSNYGLQFAIDTGSGIKLYQGSTTDYHPVVVFEETQLIFSESVSRSYLGSIYYR